MALTPKRKAFAQAVASGKTQADAYRIAFDATKMKAETIAQAASRLMADSNVRAMVDEIRGSVVEAAKVTLAGHLARLHDLSNKAEQEGKYSAAVAAEISRGKAAGLYIERAEITGKDGAPLRPMSELSTEEIRAALAKIGS